MNQCKSMNATPLAAILLLFAVGLYPHQINAESTKDYELCVAKIVDEILDTNENQIESYSFGWMKTSVVRFKSGTQLLSLPKDIENFVFLLSRGIPSLDTNAVENKIKQTCQSP